MRFFTLSVFLIAISTACSTTTVYIVRHAEKVNETDTTDLTRAGYARATALADSLADKGIDSIFTTPYRRTRQTAQTLAKRVGVQTMDYPGKPIEAIADRISRIRNKTILVVGHSNTILEIASAIGAKPAMTRIEASDFDNLFRLKIRKTPFRQSVTFSSATYGTLTPP